MERFKALCITVAIAAMTAVCAPVASQTSQDAATPEPRAVRKAAQRPMPFSPGSEMPGSAALLEFRSYDQMSRQDRDLAADAESSISEKAGFAGLEFNQSSGQGKWSYRQIVCAALPGHLFLQFMRNEGTGDASMFSASIPRGGLGQVRIIPIVRRGYSLFSPAPINALTISAFNHIRAEESADKTPEWLATGLCYAALTGARPKIGSPEETAAQKLPVVPPGTMTIPISGGAIIRFTDVSAASRPMEWTMTFNGKGKLLKATHSRAPQAKTKTEERTPVEVEGKPVQAADPTEKAILIK